MNSKLNLIAKQAEKDKKLKFSSLIHHINEDNLFQCYGELKRNKACGIDGVTFEAYGENLEENIKKSSREVEVQNISAKTSEAGLYSEAW